MNPVRDFALQSGGNNISNGVKEYHGFGRAERLRKNFEFRKALKKGTSYRDGVFVLTISKNNGEHHRLGVSIGSSKVSLAPTRNRLKRLIREVFRIKKPELKSGPYDIIITLQRRPDCKIDYATIEKRLRVLFKKAKAL